MALTYTQDHNMWVQRVNKEISAASRFNMFMTTSSFYKSNASPFPVREKNPSRPVSSKSVEKFKAKLRSVKNEPEAALPEVNDQKNDYKLSNSLANRQRIKQLGLSAGIQNNTVPHIKHRVYLQDQAGKAGKTTYPVSKPNPKNGRSLIKQALQVPENPSFKAKEDGLSSQDAPALRVYIKELEALLRNERLKRIQSEEKLKKTITGTSFNN